MRIAAACVLSGLALTAACSKPSAPGQPTAGQTGAAAPRPAAPALFSQPHPKAGLWQTTMSTSAGPGMRMSGEMCLDASTEQAAFSSGAPSASKDCSAPTYGPAPGGGMMFDTTCRSRGTTITTHGVASGDFSSAYPLDLPSHMDPAPPGMGGDARTRIEARWVGPCKPGQKPGHASMKMTGLGQG